MVTPDNVTPLFPPAPLLRVVCLCEGSGGVRVVDIRQDPPRIHWLPCASPTHKTTPEVPA